MDSTVVIGNWNSKNGIPLRRRRKLEKEDERWVSGCISMMEVHVIACTRIDTIRAGNGAIDNRSTIGFPPKYR